MEEVQEEVLINSNNNNKLDQQSHILIKGKRTKRQRPQSPIPFVVNTSNINNNNDINVSPAASSAEDFLDSREEDEDMANCLILLAQRQSRESPKRPHYDQQEETGKIQIQHHNSKFNSRRFLEAPSSGTGMVTGKGGNYVYQCKTCNRTFPSFQALGGHRASHKKPKALMNEERSFKSQQQQQQQQILVSNSDEEDGNFRNVSSLSLQLSNNNNNNNNNRGGNSNLFSSGNMKSNKIHECSICGAEFTSGQALGGHMRRHRAAPVASTTTTNTTLSLTPMAVEVEEPRKSRKNVLFLDLDLNLPAPEDDMRESKLPFSSEQQQKQQQQQQQKSSLVFSAAPTLVDCHY